MNLIQKGFSLGAMQAKKNGILVTGKILTRNKHNTEKEINDKGPPKCLKVISAEQCST